MDARCMGIILFNRLAFMFVARGFCRRYLQMHRSQHAGSWSSVSTSFPGV
jgi:hypothetical protein